MEKKLTKIIQITSGRGPAECCWVVARVLKLLIKEAETSGIDYQLLHREEGDQNGTLQSAVLRLTGSKLESFLYGWVGTIQWVGQSKFRKMHKRKNWFIGINELQQQEEDFFIDEKAIRFDFFRAGGPGGQHVNKVSSAVRATHLPSATSVEVSNSRSQVQNRKEAIRRLKELVQAKSLEKLATQVKDAWDKHNQLERGNPVRVFNGTDFKPNHKKNKYRSSRSKEKQMAARINE